MRAALLVEGSHRLAIADIEHDEPLGREVLVRTGAVGLCHSDYHVVDGTLDRPRPMVLGHEAAGVVEAVGDAVTTVAPGDHVVTCLVMGCGDCVRCRNGEPTRCTRPEATRRAAGQPPRLAWNGVAVGQMTAIGALGECMVVDERALVRIPPDVALPTAALLGCAVVTGLGAALNVARVQAGDTVAVVGCGGVGLSAVQGARLGGATRIIAVDLQPARLELATRLGATDVVDASAGHDPVAVVHDLTGGGVDHAFEVVGRASTVRQAFEMAAPGRTAYALGIHADDAEVTLPAIGLRRGKSLVGVFMGDTRPSVDIPRYLDLWRSGSLQLEAMISQVLPLERVNDGFDAMARGDGARTVIAF